MKQILSTLFLFFVVIAATAQTNNLTLSQTIKGFVIDADSKKPLQGATIVLVNNKTKTITDANGNFSRLNKIICKLFNT